MPDFISNVNSENVNTKLQRSMEKLKKFATKNYGRITETKWTLFFLIASTIQAFLAIILEARILARNSNAQYIVSTLPSMQKPCERNTINRMSNIRGENVIFILFNIFQLWFSYNAIYNQNVIQLVTIAGVNYSVGILAIVQIIEINKWKSEAMACFPSYMFDNQFARYEVPLIVISLMSATTMVYFTWKLYQQFGWNIYKKIGADLKMQSIYKTMLIFVMFLKLDIFFMIVMAIEASTAFKTVPESPTDPRYLNPGIYWFHVCVTIIIVFLLALAFHSFRRESDIGMKIFIATWLITIIDFIILLKFSIKSASEDSWFFFICYIVFGIVMSLFTFLWSIFVLRNFGLGLKKHLSCESKDSTLPQHTTQLPSTFRDQQILDPFEVPPIPNNTNENNNVRINAPMRWAIDDD